MWKATPAPKQTYRIPWAFYFRLRDGNKNSLAWQTKSTPLNLCQIFRCLEVLRQNISFVSRNLYDVSMTIIWNAQAEGECTVQNLMYGIRRQFRVTSAHSASSLHLQWWVIYLIVLETLNIKYDDNIVNISVYAPLTSLALMSDQHFTRQLGGMEWWPDTGENHVDTTFL